jgi:hypothetical protein
LSPANISKLLSEIKLTAESLIGQEMIYECANLIQDYITDSNIFTGSAHEIRENELQVLQAKLSQEREEQLKAEELNNTKIEGEIQNRVNNDLERKSELLKENKTKRMKEALHYSRNQIPNNWVPLLANAIICPIGSGSIANSQRCPKNPYVLVCR